MTFWLKTVKKNWPHTCSWKGDDFNSLFSNGGYSSLILCQILTSSVLKVRYNVESETWSVNFLYSATLKLIGLSCILNGCFTHARFVTSCVDHLENIGSIRYANLLNVDTFQHMNLKNYILIITANLTRKVFK